MIVYRLLFSLRLTPEMLAPSYTKRFRFDNQKWGFAQQSGGIRLHFRHRPQTGARLGKCPPDMLEFQFRRPIIS